MSVAVKTTRTQVWMESLGDWSWPGTGAAAVEVLPPAWVPAFPPRLERSITGPSAAPAPDSWGRRRAIARWLAWGAVAVVLAVLCAALALEGLYRDLELRVEEAVTAVELEPHGQREWNVESVIGHFVDASWAYRFGPPAQDSIVVSLERDGGDRDGTQTLGQAVRFPAGRPLERESPEQMGLEVQSTSLVGGDVRLVLASRRLAYGVRIDVAGFLPSDDGFFIEPGGVRSVTLRRTAPHSSFAHGRITAVNLQGQLELALGAPSR